MTSNLFYRKNAIFVKVDVCNEEKSAIQCAINGCIYDCLYQCYLCKKYTCFHHSNSLSDHKTVGNLHACDICYLDNNLNDVIVATQHHNNKKSIWGKSMEKFKRFISFEWIYNIEFKIKPMN